MSYYGEREYNEFGELTGIGGRHIQDLSESHQDIIDGMKRAKDCLNIEQADYALTLDIGEKNSVYERMYNEIAIQVIERCREALDGYICEHIVLFADSDCGEDE